MAIFKEGDRVKLSTKGRYGLRALIDLAQYSEQTPVSITSISSRQDLSERYLEQLMSMLKKAGLVRSVRGAGGGYVLAKPADQISVGDVLRALEGSLEPDHAEPSGGGEQKEELPGEQRRPGRMQKLGQWTDVMYGQNAGTASRA